MKKLIVVSLIALIAVSVCASDRKWGEDKWRIPTYKESTFVIQVFNELHGRDYCVTKMVGNYRVYNSFIYKHSSTTKYLELKLDCKLLSETIVDDKYNDRLSLIKYNNPQDKAYAMVFSELNKKMSVVQTVIIHEFNKAEPETITVTNTVETIVYSTNTVESTETEVNPLDNINFKFHKGVSYE